MAGIRTTKNISGSECMAKGSPDISRVAFIGGGAMAEAMINGVLDQKLVGASQIVVAEPRSDRSEEMRAKYGIRVVADNPAAVDGAAIVVLSVKPQVLGSVLAGLKGKIPGSALVISIIAGAKISTLVEGLSHPALVRSMPNTPAQIGQGMTVWTASSETSAAQRDQAKAILGALGVEAFVDEENFLDMATALSGSGPAYVFLFLEALVDAGVHLGFPRPVAEQLVMQTVKGSVEYAQKSAQPLARLRNQVTSPGGTTAEALYFLEKAGFRTTISRAIWAAYQRSIQLGKGKS
jgi:pyrroline-5-carboxylate reductase